MINPKIEHIIFDLDGTLYALDWESFSVSHLWKQVKRKYTELMAVYTWDPDDAFERYVREEMDGGISVSENIASNIWITRHEVFVRTWWMIDPKTVIRWATIDPLFLSSLRKRYWLSVLTASPKIWANTVLEYLQVRDCFMSIVTAEGFSWWKMQGFQRLLSEHSPISEQVMTFWDQEHTDIVPAAMLGIQWVLVRWPRDIYHHFAV